MTNHSRLIYVHFWSGLCSIFFLCQKVTQYPLVPGLFAGMSYVRWLVSFLNGFSCSWYGSLLLYIMIYIMCSFITFFVGTCTALDRNIFLFPYFPVETEVYKRFRSSLSHLRFRYSKVQNLHLSYSLESWNKALLGSRCYCLDNVNQNTKWVLHRLLLPTGPPRPQSISVMTLQRNVFQKVTIKKVIIQNTKLGLFLLQKTWSDLSLHKNILQSLSPGNKVVFNNHAPVLWLYWAVVHVLWWGWLTPIDFQQWPVKAIA